MACRSVSVRFGSQGSIIDWLLVPRLGAIREALGNAMVELEQLRTLDVVRAVADGRLDFGIVREDAVPAEMKRWRLGSVGYALFAANALWKGYATAEDVIRKAPVEDLLPGGQFSTRWQEWLSKKNSGRVCWPGFPRSPIWRGSFKPARPPEFCRIWPRWISTRRDSSNEPIAALKSRTLVLIANARCLDRIGVLTKAVEQLAWQMKLS